MFMIHIFLGTPKSPGDQMWKHGRRSPLEGPCPKITSVELLVLYSALLIGIKMYQNIKTYTICFGMNRMKIHMQAVLLWTTGVCCRLAPTHSLQLQLSQNLYLVGGLEHVSFFQKQFGISSSQLTKRFFRGVGSTTNQKCYIPILIDHY